MPPKTAPSNKELVRNIEEDDDEEVENIEDDRDTRLRRQFVLFVTVGDEHSPGTHILLSQSDVWMKQAKVISGRKLTSTDTGICFFKFRKYKLNFDEYLEFLQILAEYKNISVDDIIEKMIDCGPPPKPATKIP